MSENPNGSTTSNPINVVTRFFSERLWLFPVAMFTVSMSGMIIVYIVAVTNGRVDAIFPYISEAGALPPESCIFGFFLTIGAILCAVCMLLRHRQLVALYGDRLRVRGHYWRPLSQLCLVLGFVSCVGVLMVANFQASNLYIVHMVGAMMGFAIGLLYCWAQTILSFVMKPRMISAILLYSRLGLCIFGVLLFIISYALLFTSIPDMTNTTTPASGYQWGHWDHDDPTFTGHVISAACEWLMISCILLYILSYAYELRGTRWRSGSIEFPPGGTWDIQTKLMQMPVPVTDVSTHSTPADSTLIHGTPNPPLESPTQSDQMVDQCPVPPDSNMLGLQRSVSCSGSTQRS